MFPHFAYMWMKIFSNKTFEPHSIFKKLFINSFELGNILTYIELPHQSEPLTTPLYSQNSRFVLHKPCILIKHYCGTTQTTIK